MTATKDKPPKKEKPLSARPRHGFLYLAAVIASLAGQLFTYWLCLLKGLDPDSPRGLEKITQTR